MIEPELLLDAYRHGIFPMAVSPDMGVGAGKRGDIGWFSPDPRAIIPLDDRFHIPHGLRRVWKRCVVAISDSGRAGWPSPPSAGSKSGAVEPPRPTGASSRFFVTFDTDFEAVIRACAKRKEDTWISKEIIESYCNLHRLGHAHSVEVWQVDKTDKTAAPRSTLHPSRASRLAGGLYGVHIGGAFFGESMFHRATDASKVALVALVERLRACGFVLLDTQWQTPHLTQFGTHEISRTEYLRRLRRAVAIKCEF
jgi:leucyl/phenylalanyl-tRNA--protein transferase